jgi:hypothetical protein
MISISPEILEPWVARLTLVTLIAGLAVINATGVYAQLVAAHMGDRGGVTAAIETQDSALAAKIDVQAHTVADLDRRLGQIDTAIEEAAKRGKTNAALSAMEGQRRSRAGLVDERRREAGTRPRQATPNRAGSSRLRQIRMMFVAAPTDRSTSLSTRNVRSACAGRPRLGSAIRSANSPAPGSGA